VRVDSLFLDEEALETALETLAGLQQGDGQAHRRYLACGGTQGTYKHADTGNTGNRRAQQPERSGMQEDLAGRAMLDHLIVSKKGIL